MNQTLPTPALATINEACIFLNISRTKLYELMGSGQLPTVRLGTTRRINWDDLRRIATAK